MAIAERELARLLADKDELRRLMAEQNALMGAAPDPTATAEKARAMSLALGIRPEENAFYDRTDANAVRGRLEGRADG